MIGERILFVWGYFKKYRGIVEVLWRQKQIFKSMANLELSKEILLSFTMAKIYSVKMYYF